MSSSGEKGSRGFRCLIRRKRVDSGRESQQLAKKLSAFDLVAIGVGSTIGAGVYILVGTVAREQTGPGIIISFLIGGIAAALSAFCYAELACRCPSAGSAYHYTYICVGEGVAWLIGWALILEYTLGSAAVARGVSPNLALFLGGADKLPSFLARQSIFGIVVDPCAAILVCIVAFLLCLGIKESSLAQTIVTTVNVAAMVFIIIAGLYVGFKTGWAGYELHSGYFPFGVNGIFAGSATLFYSYVGFDSVTSTAEEVKNPQQDLPFGIGIALSLCCILYMLVSAVIVGLVPYYLLDQDTPISSAFASYGMEWAAYVITVGAVTALCSGLIGGILPQPRILMAMARDGLLPSFFSDINKHTKVPVKSTVVTGISAAALAFLMDIEQLTGMVSVGTLLAFTTVAISILILRYVPPEEVPFHSSLHDSIHLVSESSVSNIQEINREKAKDTVGSCNSGGDDHLVGQPLFEKVAPGLMASRGSPHGHGNKPRGRGNAKGNMPHNIPPAISRRGILGPGLNPFGILDGDSQSNMVDLQEFLNTRKKDLDDFLAQKKTANKAASSSSGQKSDLSLAERIQQPIIYEASHDTEYILTLEDDDLKWSNDPWYLKKKYLDRFGYSMSQDKHRIYYESILTTTGSVEIRHFFNNNRPSEHINYSKCNILKVFSIIDWGNDPMKIRKLKFSHDSTEYSFNFWDYINAWKYTFYYENEKKKHSWFFRIQEEFFSETKIIPPWFFQWWKNFGPALSLMPKQIQDLYDSWIEFHPIFNDLNNKSYDRQPVFYYWAESHLPWIWKWGITVDQDDQGIPILIRTFHFRWWDQIDIPDTIKKIVKISACYKQQHDQGDPVPESKSGDYLSQLRKSLQRRYPNASNKDIMARCLMLLQGEFKSTFTSTENMSVDTLSSHSEDTVLAGEAQDPDPDNPSTQDILDSVIELLRDKGKGHM